MGTIAPSGLAAALFAPVQQRLVGLLFGQAHRRFQGAELIRLVGSGTGAVVRQLSRLVEAGLVTVVTEGNRKFYQANPVSPIFAELQGIALKTTGLAEPLRVALAPLAQRIERAFVYGSTASGTDRAASDIDLMVISETLTYAELFAAAHPVESTLGRTINPTVMSRQDWDRKRQGADAFAQRVSRGLMIMLIGHADEGA
jgi:predicted nucleotidyltransferase